MIFYSLFQWVLVQNTLFTELEEQMGSWRSFITEMPRGINLQHVAVIRVQITQCRLLLFTLPRVLAQALRALPVLGNEGKEVQGAASCGKSEECKGEGVSPNVLGGITGHDAEGSDRHGAGTEANLEGGTDATSQVSTDYRNRILGVGTGESIDVDSRLALYQQTIMGAAAAGPIKTKNSAPYLTPTPP